MKKYLLFMPLLLSFANYGLAESTVEHSNDVDIKFNILKPVCRLMTSNKTLDFGEFDINKLNNTTPEAKAILKFTDCIGTTKMHINFSGNYVNYGENYIQNSVGDNYASGIAIKLYNNDNNEFDLDKNHEVNVNGVNDFEFNINAKVIPLNTNSSQKKPGLLKSSVIIYISYD
ncbi:TPA: type 1 fimbrial protein [Klebsiella quasipneumoniae subsp. similipneumoniae]|nr:type 1 fimbrial protein [Klebsiella quasipneumoniae subsp. similipneumoniae]